MEYEMKTLVCNEIIDPRDFIVGEEVMKEIVKNRFRQRFANMLEPEFHMEKDNTMGTVKCYARIIVPKEFVKEE